MYVGHYAPALLAKAGAREVPLWSLFLAAQGLDFLFDALGVLGIERLSLDPGARGPLAMRLEWMPYSHSLLAALGWGALVAVAGAALGRARAGLALGAVVASHWFLDVIVHTPDLHLGLGAEPRLGLGLWRWPVASVAVELALLGASAVALARSGVRRRRLWIVVGAMAVTQVAFAVGPPLPSVAPALLVASAAYVVWALAAAWVER